MATDADLDAAAALLLEWVGRIDPSWQERLKGLMEERNFTARAALGACLGYVLDHALHMAVPYREEFESAGTLTPGEKECPVCEIIFRPAYPSQPLCSNICAEVYYMKPKPAKAVKPESYVLDTVHGPVEIPKSAFVND